MRNYNINKIYHGSESRNVYGYETGISESDLSFKLDVHESSWKRAGGSIVERGDDFVTVEESDGSQTITFQAVEL